MLIIIIVQLTREEGFELKSYKTENPKLFDRKLLSK